jgi:hypothetical protein
MTLVGAIVSELTALQLQNWMAKPPAALMVPALKTVPSLSTEMPTPVPSGPTLIVPVLTIRLRPSPKPKVLMPVEKLSPTVIVPLLMMVFWSPSTAMPAARLPPVVIVPVLVIVFDDPFSTIPPPTSPVVIVPELEMLELSP